MKRLAKKHEALAYSAVGLAALFLILVAVNFLASTASLRADLTEGRLHTLSPGTKKVLRELSAPVKVKLYISAGEAMPVPLRSFARRVAGLVDEFKAVAGPNLVVERYDPRPDSEEEDAAQLDGIEPQQLASGEQFYLGLAASRLERKQAIPVLAPARERLLEYDLIRAIARAGASERPKIGLMSGLPVLGQQYNPYTRQSAEPWVLANELRRDFDVHTVNLTATAIDPDLKVLLLIHPRDIGEQAEYALDQFVLRGGKLIAFVDPYAYFDQQPTPMPGMPPMVTSSALPRLFQAWGVGMAPGKVIADVVFASGEGQRFTPTVLSLNRTAFARDDVVMAQIETLLYAFGGAFDVKPADGLAVTELVRSSPNNMLVDEAKATVAGEEATRSFVPSGRSLPLALRLSGKFRTAFPGGRPADKTAKPAAAAAASHLAESARDNAVVLVADVDMLQDGAAVEVQEVFGRRIVVPSNGNLAFAQGLVEQLAADESLLSLKSRAASFRPLTVVREMEAEAQVQYFGKIKELEDELQKTNAALQSLQGGASQGAQAKGAQILTPEQQAELDRFRKKVAETRLALKELRKNLRHDAERLVFLTKVANIALMPILVALAGLGVALVRRRRQARLAAA
ncbi:MAG: GldG family protein [Betaproteobacteria bacterium]|nr:GldG family protein [Betaproteobacteria bacterium]MDH5351177.1 GldG family protein [Betaproteobacteria bacterium]